MNLWPKILLWLGIGLVLLGGDIPSAVMFRVGLADFVVPSNRTIIAAGICCIVGALAAWKLRPSPPKHDDKRD